jgi:exopolysaccharide biosynthesis polyprenyl glycosylphosphotransferase
MATRILERPKQAKRLTGATAPRTYPIRWVAILLATDIALFVIASNLGALIGFHHWNSPRIVRNLLVAEVIYVVLWVFVFDRLGLYRRTYALSMKDELYYTVAALAIGTIPQLVVFTIYPGISTSRIGLIFALIFSIVLVGSSRALLHNIRQNQWMHSRRRVGIVGAPEHIEEVANNLELAENSETLLIAIDHSNQEPEQIDLSRDPNLRRIEWFNHARAWGCDSLILTEMIAPTLLAHLLEVAAADRIRLAFAPPQVARHSYELSLQTDGSQVLIVPSRLRACTPRAQLIKRLMDVTFGCLALLLFAPVMIVAAIAVVLDSGFPILYSQERVGVGGKTFRIFKFRSMRADAEKQSGAVWAKTDDPRKTRIGGFLRRFSIDELPQIFNVLRGDMSLVGPRPERPVFVDLFRSTIPSYDERHLVRPGITGWSHVHMRRNVDTSAAGERLQYDLQYLQSWSPYLDVAILFQTLCEFLFHRAA